MGYEISSIYKIKNLKNNKIYIGSASFTYSRWGRHRGRLRKGTHCNRYLQNSWNKNGEKSFQFTVLEIVENKQDLIQKEQYWIDQTKCYDRNIGYNIATKAGSTLGIATNLGRKRSKEEIERVSEKRARDWIVTNPQGIEIQIHNLKKFCIDNNLSQASMSNVAHNKRTLYKGWKCRKISKNHDGVGRHWTPDQREKNTGRKMSKKAIEKTRQAHLKKWIVITPLGIQLSIDDMTQFCKENNLRATSMHRVGRGERSHHKGWRCRRLDNG